MTGLATPACQTLRRHLALVRRRKYDTASDGDTPATEPQVVMTTNVIDTARE